MGTTHGSLSGADGMESPTEMRRRFDGSLRSFACFRCDSVRSSLTVPSLFHRVSWLLNSHVGENLTQPAVSSCDYAPYTPVSGPGKDLKATMFPTEGMVLWTVVNDGDPAGGAGGAGEPSHPHLILTSSSSSSSSSSSPHPHTAQDRSRATISVSVPRSPCRQARATSTFGEAPRSPPFPKSFPWTVRWMNTVLLLR